jgi:putative DNA primase/helicase
MAITPTFENLEDVAVLDHIEELKNIEEPTPHAEILNSLIDQFELIDFVVLAFPEAVKIREKLSMIDPDCKEAELLKAQLVALKLTAKHYIVLSIENVIEVAERNDWGIAKNLDYIYLYNSCYWRNVDKESFQKFLGEASEAMGVKKFDARFYQFRDQLFRQFLATAYLPTPEPPRDAVFINLKNGTFEVTPKGTKLNPFNRSNFLTYQLPFEYDPQAKAPIFEAYLNRVLPDKQRQMILAEYVGFVFIRNGSSTMKEEKTLLLYGTGANGKSVFFEIVNALLGNENVSSYSLQSLTNENGYFRAKIANKLVNYASEISGNLQTALFKQLVSGEPVEARLPYGQPFTLTQYAKLIFNCNELPKDVEHTKAYFRRFLIVPFEVVIPEKEQDKRLHIKIIENELAGVFNWVLEGLNRLLEQKRFTHCEAVSNAVNLYERQSDSVNMFIEDNEYKPNADQFKLLKELYNEYRSYCVDDGYKPVNKGNFIKRLKTQGILIEKKNVGNVVFVTNIPY